MTLGASSAPCTSVMCLATSLAAITALAYSPQALLSTAWDLFGTPASAATRSAAPGKNPAVRGETRAM